MRGWLKNIVADFRRSAPRRVIASGGKTVPQDPLYAKMADVKEWMRYRRG